MPKLQQLDRITTTEDTFLIPICDNPDGAGRLKAIAVGDLPAGGGGGGTGSVTSVSVLAGNGFSGVVTNPTTTPAITLRTTVTGILKGNGTAISAATAGVDYAGLTSPAFTGTPTAPTAANGTNTTQIATTAFVLANSAPASNVFPTGIVVNGDAIVKTMGYSSIYDNGVFQGAGTINWASGNIQRVSVHGPCTLTFNAPNHPGPIVLYVNQGTGSGSFTYPASVKTTGGFPISTTTTSGATDVITGQFDGTNYYMGVAIPDAR